MQLDIKLHLSLGKYSNHN